MGYWTSTYWGGTIAGDTTAPSPAPDGTLEVSGSTVTFTRSNAAEASATSKLYRRANGSTGAWAEVDTDATPAIGTTLVDSGVSDGTYEYEVRDLDVSANATNTGRRWCGVVVASSTWDTVLAVVIAQLEGQGVSSNDIFEGRNAPSNYSKEVWIVRATTIRTEQSTNNMNLNAYPVELEYRAKARGHTGKEAADFVQDAHHLVANVFRFKGPDTYSPSLPDLEQSEVSFETADQLPGGILTQPTPTEVVSRMTVTFRIWESD